MERYDYRTAVEEDIKNYLSENVSLEDFDDYEGLFDRMHEEMWVADSVTGNGSGSYTCNAYQAEEYLCHNWELLEEACNEFGCDIGEEFKKGAENCDVTIRCYLLAGILCDALSDFQSELEEVAEDEEEDGKCLTLF